MKVLGVDEAGRGPVIGPLVMCGYLVDDSKLPELKLTGVRDSKQLTPEKRSEIDKKLRKLADDYVVLQKSASDIDRLRGVSNLNKMEIDMMAQIINALQPGVAIVDAPEANTKGFHAKLAKKVHGIEIVAENFAEKNHVQVSAASVIAKVRRDAEIGKLHKAHGYFGSGYSSDPDTISFLKSWIKKNKGFPDFVRKSWITAQVIRAEHEQRSIMKFTVDENEN